MRQLCLCISTYNRPEGLTKLLESVVEQKGLEPHNVTICIAIADNQTPPATEAIAEHFRINHQLEIRWQHEAVQGITYARNTTFRLASGADMYLFVDDDEMLDPFCIAEMLRVKEEFNADMVYGNAPPVFEQESVAPWIKDYFTKELVEDGQELGYAPTNCLLIDHSVLRGMDAPFDHGFAHTGGEDTYLTRTLVKRGAKLVKSAHANAYDLVPPERCTVAWILKRVKREAAIYSLISLKLSDGLLVYSLRWAKLGIKFLLGALLTLPYLLFTRTHKLKGLILIWDAIGGFLGYFSYKSKAYTG